MKPADELRNALSESERDVWDALSCDHQDSLIEIFSANMDTSGRSQALEVVRRALANRTKKPNAEKDLLRTSTATKPSLTQYEQNREREREAFRQDVARRARAFNTETSAQREERLKREERPERKKRSSGKAPTEAVTPKPETPAAPPAADREALEKALAVAPPADALNALARLEWLGSPKVERVPALQLPTEERLSAWLAHCPEEAQEEASQHLDCLLAPARGHGWHWSRVRSRQDPEFTRLAAICYTFDGELVFQWDENNQIIVPAVLSFKQVHAAWKFIRLDDPDELDELDELDGCAVEPPDRYHPPHPIGPIVRAWQTRPEELLPDERSDPLFPAIIVQAKPDDHRTGRLFTAPQFVQDGPNDQMFFPQFAKTLAEPESPALPAKLYDLGSRRIERAQRGAPLVLRIFVEVCLSVEPSKRGVGPSVLGPMRLKKFLLLLYPSAREWRPSKHLPALLDALERLDSPDARIPWCDPETGSWYARRVVSPRDIPLTGRAHDWISFSVDLPPGSEQGFIVDRPALRRAGVESVTRYRLILSLSAHWRIDGRTRRPAGGKKDRHWYQSREPAHYPPISDAELVAMAYPTNPSKTRKRLFRAQQALAELIDEGFAAVEGCRILPGPKWVGWPE